MHWERLEPFKPPTCENGTRTKLWPALCGELATTHVTYDDGSHMLVCDRCLAYIQRLYGYDQGPPAEQQKEE